MDTTRINEKIALYERLLNEPSAPWDAPLAQAEQVTGVGRLKLFVAALCVLVVCLQGLGPVSTAVSLMVCHAYAVYATVALAMNPAAAVAAGRSGGGGGGGARGQAAASRKWYTFWMLSAALLLIENHLWFAVYVVPYYTLVKTVFLLWCSAPIENNGCAWLLDHVLRPYFGPVTKVAAARRLKAGRRATFTAAADVATDSQDDVTTIGAPDVTTLGAPDVAAAAAPDVTTIGVPDVSTIGAPDVTTVGVPDVTTIGAPDVATATPVDRTTADVTAAAPVDRTTADVTAAAPVDRTTADVTAAAPVDRTQKPNATPPDLLNPKTDKQQVQ